MTRRSLTEPFMPWDAPQRRPPLRRRTRADDVFDAIKFYALENAGVTPSQQELGDTLRLSQQRISYLLLILERRGKIQWITRQKYRVVPAELRLIEENEILF